MSMISRTYKTILAGLSSGILAGAAMAPAAADTAHAHAPGHGAGASHGARDLGIGAAIDGEGRLWVASKENAGGEQYVVVQSTSDLGKTWSAPVRVQKSPEPVAASGEARPHIAFGGKGEVYVSYTSTVARPHIGNIRFVRSLDGGQSFSEPKTVHANQDFVTHSFESMVVDRDGRVYVAWIDGRDAGQAKKRNEAYAGSAVYYAVSSDRGASFRGDYKVADHSCECCRIGFALNPQGQAVALWRHVFSPNIRDHALSTLRPDGTVSPLSRVTYDDWRVDACPHHGPSIAYGADGTRHQVWFNGKEGAGGPRYAAIPPKGKAGPPMALGTEQASHADVAVLDKRVVLAWKEFDGKAASIVAKLSDDSGRTWTQTQVASTTANSDKPYLLTASSAIVLVWRTQNEGIRVIPLQKEAP